MYDVVWPRGRRVVERVLCANRLDTLEGKTIAELWDWVYEGDKIFPWIEKELAKRYSGIRFIGYEAFGSTHGADEANVLAAIPDKLKQNKCDAAISGVGC